MDTFLDTVNTKLTLDLKKNNIANQIAIAMLVRKIAIRFFLKIVQP